MLEAYFRNMKIAEYRIDWLDGGRMSYLYPHMGYLKVSGNREIYSYLYFVKDDIESKLNRLFLDLENNSEHRYIFNIIKNYVIFFEDTLEKEKFHEYLQKNIDDIVKESKKYIEEYSYIHVPEGLLREKVIEELCLQKEIVKIFNDKKMMNYR